MNTQVEQSLSILEQVVNAATAGGIFKKASEAALVAQAFQIISEQLKSSSEGKLEGPTSNKVKK